MNLRGAPAARQLTRICRAEPTAAGEAAAPADSGDVHFESRGGVLVAGPAALAIPAGEQLAATLRVLVCATGTVPRSSLRSNPVTMSGRIARISGHLGRFTVKAYGRDNALADLAPFSPNPDGFFDLVLDFNTPPLLKSERPGYSAPGADAAAIPAAIAALRELTGRFRQPRYIDYDAARCAHAAQGVAGCTRCLAACPSGAISSAGERVRVDPHLCQGCAACALACPTAALSEAEARDGQRDAFDRALEAWQERGASAPSLSEAALPAEAPFGTVELDQSSCTLCLACAHLCPTGALSAGADRSTLHFIESKCAQCRICERTCPEHALSLRPRLLLDPAARHAARVLMEDARHRCPGCDSPFIGRALLDKSMQLMRAQGLLDDKGVERLKLCPECRLGRF